MVLNVLPGPAGPARGQRGQRRTRNLDSRDSGRCGEVDPEWESFPVLHELFFAFERWIFVEERLGEVKP